MIESILCTLCGYLLGSIPFGLVLTRLAGYGDIRNIGSGNIGATNVLRTGNKPLALATLLLDAGKGGIAVLCVQLFSDPGAVLTMGLTAGTAAMIGHCFPIWLGFKGGKGVATTFGTLLAVLPIVGALSIATWLVMAAVFRISSLAALVAVGLTPLYVWSVALVAPGILPLPVAASIACLVIATIVIYRHKENIVRLRAGTEPRIGAAKSNVESP